MTEFELLTLYDEAGALLGAQVDTYLTILFAFVVVAYLVADKLTKTMMYVAIGLFTEATFLVVFAMFRTCRDIVNLAGEIRALGQDVGSPLSFHALATEPVFVMASVPWMFMGLIFVAYGAVMFLFVHVRSQGQIATQASS